MRALTAVAVAALSANLAVPAKADVRVEQRPDGTKVIIGEPAEARTRRLSGNLISPPSETLRYLIDSAATDQALEPRLVQAVMQVESGYNEKALSKKGAMGLMQLMPETAAELAVSDPWNVDQNVRGGAAYLRKMLDTFGDDLVLALAAYNAGPTAVAKYDGVPPFEETREYVRRVMCLLEGVCEEGSGVPGRKVRIVRDAQNRILLTTEPGG